MGVFLLLSWAVRAGVRAPPAGLPTLFNRFLFINVLQLSQDKRQKGHEIYIFIIPAWGGWSEHCPSF